MTKITRPPAKTQKHAANAKPTRTPAKKQPRVRSRRKAANAKRGPAQTQKAQKPPGKLYVVYGADEFARPRAARFYATDGEPVAKAAQALNLRLLEVTDPDVAEVAKLLPAGRLHASGPGLVPYIKGDRYIELVAAMAYDQLTPSGPRGTAVNLPATWDDIAPGHLVIAKETHEGGWWEAIVVERNGDLLTLRYRDWPDHQSMVRHRSVVALIGAPAP